MIFKEYKTPVEYNWYIKSIYSYHCTHPNQYKFFIPDGNLELMLSDQPISIDTNSQQILDNERSIFWGQIRFTGNIESLVPYTVWGMKFQPWFLPVISKNQNEKLIDRIVSAGEVFPKHLINRFQDFFNLWDFKAPDHQLITNLSDRITQHFNPNLDLKPNFSNVLQLIEQRHGLMAVPEILSFFRQSPRTLQYDFQQYIGLTPKAYLDIVRFRKACINLKTSQDILDSALEFGFYDQPHFNRKFKSLCAKSPRTFLKESNLVLSTI